MLKTNNCKEKRIEILIAVLLVIFTSLVFIVGPAVVKDVSTYIYAAQIDGSVTDGETDTDDGSETDDGSGDESDDGDGDSDSGGETSTPKSIDFTNAPSEMTVGDTATIKYELGGVPSGAEVDWKSGNEEIVTVDNGGTVKAISPGKVEITATLSGYSAKASVLITVKEVEATKITIEVKEFTAEDMLLKKHELTIGDELHLSVSVTPEDAKVEISWESDDNSVITVEENGLLKAKALGDAVVKVKSGELSDEMSFSVVEEKKGFWDYIFYYVIGGIILIIIIFIIVMLALRSRRKKREQLEREEEARRTAAARELRNRVKERNAAEEANPFAGLADTQTEDRRTIIFETPEPDETQQKDVEPDVPADNMGAFEDSRTVPEAEDEEPDKPFSLDDID